MRDSDKGDLLLKLRVMLDEKEAEYESNRAAALMSPESDECDQGTEEARGSLAATFMERDDAQILRIKHAIARFEGGFDGRCVGGGCGDLIPIDRLMTLPWTTLCTSCQSAIEVAANSRGRAPLRRHGALA